MDNPRRDLVEICLQLAEALELLRDASEEIEESSERDFSEGGASEIHLLPAEIEQEDPFSHVEETSGMTTATGRSTMSSPNRVKVRRRSGRTGRRRLPSLRLPQPMTQEACERRA